MGEYFSNSTTGTNTPTTTIVNATSVTLTPGDWDVWGTIHFTSSVSGAITFSEAGISINSATMGGLGTLVSYNMTNANGTGMDIATPVVRLSISGSTTVYTVGGIVFASGTATSNGFIAARRVR